LRAILILLVIALVISVAVLGLLIGRRMPRETESPPPGSEPPQESAQAPLPEASPAGPEPPEETPGFWDIYTPLPPYMDAQTAEARAQEILAGMTREEKIYQLFVVYPDDMVDESPVIAAGDKTRAALEQYPVCGFIYSPSNIVTAGQISEMVRKHQEFSPKIPLLTSLDEEGGTVHRLMGKVGTTWMDDMFSYKDQGSETSYFNARTIADDIKSLGFNTDFAPVADVWSNPDNTVIGNRAYSDDYIEAASLVAGAVRGFKDGIADGGVICTLKHFPGHGNTVEDSHYSSAMINKSLDDLRQEEFLPFRSGIAMGADMVMVGFLTVTDIDSSTPAAFSSEIVTGLLRNELSFDGVVITDGMGMEGALEYGRQCGSRGFTLCGDLCVRAIEAGCDILLGPTNFHEGFDAISSALDSGLLTQERIDESVLRILKMKLVNGVIADQI